MYYQLLIIVLFICSTTTNLLLPTPVVTESRLLVPGVKEGVGMGGERVQLGGWKHRLPDSPSVSILVVGPE